ncbi:hypothetical protein Taro_049775 [Colocasia esculenta]|uniref:Uncharacterized protein n=1 Tax=Colocasia esculenta TaxID=4460 RepID=A0A843XBZ0_COLES|nr:hypothetical protein [Colocasia esculenta]
MKLSHFAGVFRPLAELSSEQGKKERRKRARRRRRKESLAGGGGSIRWSRPTGSSSRDSGGSARTAEGGVVQAPAHPKSLSELRVP